MKKMNRTSAEVNTINTTNTNEKEMVINMKKNSKKSGRIFKVIGIISAAAMLLTAGSIIASATTEHDTVIINGKETEVKFKDFGNDCRMWQYENNDTSYAVFIYGDYDKDSSKLTFTDHGDYFLASTDPEQTLNLYTDIDKSDVAEFSTETGGNYLCLTYDNATDRVAFSYDTDDGVADGKITHDDSVETYAVLPNGAVVNTIKEHNVGLKSLMSSFIR